MFDIGFWELSLIGVIALLVVGPERLPGMARTVGYWVGRTRRYVSHVRDDIEREIRADELREIMHKAEIDEIRDAVGEAGSVIKDTVRGIESAGRDEPRAAPSPSGAASSPATVPSSPEPSPPAESAANGGIGEAIADAGGKVLAEDPTPAEGDGADGERRDAKAHDERNEPRS